MAAKQALALSTTREDLASLKDSALDDLAQAELHAGLAVVYAARAGHRFAAMKTIVEGSHGYGSWGLYVSANVGLSARSVQLYMQLAKALPELADPAVDVAKVLQESPAARELAGLSLRRAMQKLSEPKAPKALDEPEPEPDEPQDPRPIVEAWASKHLPLMDEVERAALVTRYLEVQPEFPPNGKLFELTCEVYTMGHRAGIETAKRTATAAVRARTGRPKPERKPEN